MGYPSESSGIVEPTNSQSLIGKTGVEQYYDAVLSGAIGSKLAETDSKGAIYSAVSILAKHLDMALSEIDKIYIAGGFGTFLDIEKAIKIGLLPDIERAKFIFIGNSSLAGARQALLSAKGKQLAKELAAKITHFELSLEPGYMDEYSQALFFPHTDLAKFPTVRF